MKVLYVSKALVVPAYRDKLHALAQYCDVHAVVPSRWDGRVVDAAIDGGKSITFEPALFSGHNHLHLYRHAASFLRDAKPDIVHIDEEPYSAVTAQLAWHCRRHGVPYVFFAWQNLEKRIPPPFGTIRSYVFGGAHGGIAGTDRAAAVLRAWGWSGPVAVIPQFGIDPEKFRPDTASRTRVRNRLNIDDDAFVVGFGGRLVIEKGVYDLLHAISELPSATLILMGAGPEQAALEAAARERGMQHRIVFVGAVDSREVPAWLNAFDVLVLPSVRTRRWMEQFGRILVEAMACGVAVVGTDSGEIPTVIGDAGIVVPEHDVAALRITLARLADRSDERATLGHRGRQRVLAHFTQQRVARETAEFYTSVLAAA